LQRSSDQLAGEILEGSEIMGGGDGSCETCLSDRNVQNTAARYEQRVKESFDMASRETQDFVTYLDNTVAAVRLLLWPCTCYIAQKQIEIQKVEKPKNENEEMKEGEEGEGEGEGEKAGAGEEEAKEEEGNEESNGEKGEEEEEGGGGMKKVEEEEEVIEIKWLRWVSTSHPCKDTIEGFALKYEEEGMLGPVLNHRTIVFVPDVSVAPNLRWFRKPPAPLKGSFAAAPLVDPDGSTWGVLLLDTLLDGRALRDEDVEKVAQIAKLSDSVRSRLAAHAGD